MKTPQPLRQRLAKITAGRLQIQLRTSLFGPRSLATRCVSVGTQCPHAQPRSQAPPDNPRSVGAWERGQVGESCSQSSYHDGTGKCLPIRPEHAEGHYARKFRHITHPIPQLNSKLYQMHTAIDLFAVLPRRLPRGRLVYQARPSLTLQKVREGLADVIVHIICNLHQYQCYLLKPRCCYCLKIEQ